MDEMLSKVKRLSGMATPDGRSLKEVLAYEGVSLWWFIEHSAYLRLKGDRCRKLTNQRHLIYLVCASMKFFILIKSLFRCVFGKLGKFPKTAGSKRIMVCSSLWHWRETQDQTTLRPKKDDVIVGGVMDALERDGFDVLGIDRDDSHLIDFKRFFDKLVCGKTPWRPVEAYLTLGMVRTAFSESRSMEKKWDEFLRHLASEDKLVFNRLSGDFKVFFVYHIFQAILHMEMAKRAIESDTPELIVIINEHSDSGRAIVMAGKLLGIPTLAIQHGFYAHDSVMYFNNPGEFSNEISTKYRQRPDKIAMYGPWIKNLFIKNFNYPREAVVVTGQPRYDILTKLEKGFNREEFCRNYNLDSDKKIALVITQPLDIAERRDIFLRSVLNALGRFSDITILIKPHPREDENWHKTVLREERMDATVLGRDSNIYEALCACDVIITISSTTIVEAMILGKPVIMLNLARSPDRVPYVKDGAGLGVYRKEDLPRTIKEALYGKKTREKLKRAERKFVYRHAYRQDGKATERVINLIKEMIEHPKER